MKAFQALVKAIHTVLIAFILLVPFITRNERWLTYHFIIVGLIMIHWMTNNNVCALTQLEAFISGEEDTNETFIGQIINPVYDLNDQTIWLIVGGLFLITALKLRHQSNFALLKAICRVEQH